MYKWEFEMSIRKYIRQVRPIQENYLTPTDKVQMLSETKGTASTLFEGVIADCHNLSRSNEKTFKKKILKAPYVKRWLPLADSMKGSKKTVFATSHVNTMEEKLDILWKFSQVCKRELGGGTTDAGAGQSKAKCSEPWIEMSEKRGGVDTSKADILVGGKQTSVKGPSAQLMSGEKKESRATIIAALATTKVNKELEETLLAEVDKFVTNSRTKGAEITSGALKKMTVQQAKETGNEEVKELLDNQEAGKAAIRNAFLDAFKNKEVANAFCREAMTGYEKFGGKAFPGRPAGDSKAEATHMLIWDYRMDRMKFTPIDNALISQTAPKMKINPDLKANSYAIGGKKAGYSFYQSMRVAVDAFLDKKGDIVDKATEEVQHSRKMLSEGMINELNFKDRIKKILIAVRDKISSFVKILIEKIKQIAEKAKEIIKKGVDSALDFFELDINVNVNPVVSFKV